MLLVHPLMAGIEAPHVAAHGGDAGLLGDLHQRFGVLDAVGDRDLDQHVLAGAHHLLALAEMHLGRRGQDHRVGALDAFGQFAGVMRNAVFLGDLRGRILIAADQGRDFDVGDALERIEMLLAERALPGYANLHCLPLRSTINGRAYPFEASLRSPMSRPSTSLSMNCSANRRRGCPATRPGMTETSCECDEPWPAPRHACA